MLPLLHIAGTAVSCATAATAAVVLLKVLDKNEAKLLKFGCNK